MEPRGLPGDVGNRHAARCTGCGSARWTACLHRSRSFGLELGFPFGWQIVDELVDKRLRSRAIDAVLTSGDGARLRTLVHLLTKGEAARSISKLIRDTVNELYDLFQDTAEEAWHKVPRYKPLDEAQLAATLEELRAAELTEKRMSKARDEDCAGGRRRLGRVSEEGLGRQGGPERIGVLQQADPGCRGGHLSAAARPCESGTGRPRGGSDGSLPRAAGDVPRGVPAAEERQSCAAVRGRHTPPGRCRPSCRSGQLELSSGRADRSSAVGRISGYLAAAVARDPALGRTRDGRREGTSFFCVGTSSRRSTAGGAGSRRSSTPSTGNCRG